MDHSQGGARRALVWVIEKRKNASMDEPEQRQIIRDSLFVMVDVRLDGSSAEHRVKMRNLSSGGMMVEGALRVTKGAIVFVNIRNLGWIEGSVAWIEESRFGVAFRDVIDPILARAPVAPGNAAPRPHRSSYAGPRGGALRKV